MRCLQRNCRQTWPMVKRSSNHSVNLVIRSQTMHISVFEICILTTHLVELKDRRITSSSKLCFEKISGYLYDVNMVPQEFHNGEQNNIFMASSASFGFSLNLPASPPQQRGLAVACHHAHTQLGKCDTTLANHCKSLVCWITTGSRLSFLVVVLMNQRPRCCVRFLSATNDMTQRAKCGRNYLMKKRAQMQVVTTVFSMNELAYLE